MQKLLMQNLTYFGRKTNPHLKIKFRPDSIKFIIKHPMQGFKSYNKNTIVNFITNFKIKKDGVILFDAELSPFISQNPFFYIVLPDGVLSYGDNVDVEFSDFFGNYSQNIDFMDFAMQRFIIPVNDPNY